MNNKMGKWSDHESSLLQAAVDAFGDQKWADIARWLQQQGIARCATQCRHRWQKTQQAFLKKGQWGGCEDDMLMQAVRVYRSSSDEVLNWQAISKSVPGRTGKACRERWIGHLDPNINKAPFSQAEEQCILDSYTTNRNKWSIIAKKLPGRTAEAIKSKYKTLTRSHSCSTRKRSRQTPSYAVEFPSADSKKPCNRTYDADLGFVLATSTPLSDQHDCAYSAQKSSGCLLVDMELASILGAQANQLNYLEDEPGDVEFSPADADDCMAIVDSLLAESHT